MAERKRYLDGGFYLMNDGGTFWLAHGEHRTQIDRPAYRALLVYMAKKRITERRGEVLR